MAEIDVTELAAYWGAAIATLALGWNIFQWRRSRSRLVVDLVPSPTSAEDLSRDFAEKVGIINRGGATTTITECCYWFEFKSGGETDRTFLDDLPRRLEPGELHTFYAMTRSNSPGDTVKLVVWVHHSLRDFPEKFNISMQLLDEESNKQYLESKASTAETE